MLGKCLRFWIEVVKLKVNLVIIAKQSFILHLCPFGRRRQSLLTQVEDFFSLIKMRKTKQFQLISFIDPSFKITFGLDQLKNLDKLVNKTFNKKQIRLIDNFFKKYFDFFKSNSIDNKVKKFFINSEIGLKQKFMLDIYTEIRFSPLYSFEKEDPALLELAIIRTIHKLFFYSDLTLAGLIGNIDNFSIRVKKSSRFVHSVTDYNIKLYEEVWLKIEELNRDVSGHNMRRACVSVSKKHPENIEDYEDDNRLYKRFHKFMKENDITSLKDYLNYLSTIGK